MATETPPEWFNLNAEASRQLQAATGGIVERGVVFEEDDDDDLLDGEGEDGTAADDDALMDVDDDEIPNA